MNDDRVDEIHDLAAAYAVDAVDQGERAAFEAHLPGCQDCAAIVQELREAAAGLSAGLEVAPGPDLRRRVLDAAAAEVSHVAQSRTAPGEGQVVLPLRSPRRPMHRDVSRSARAARRHRPQPAARWLTAAAATVVLGGATWGIAQVLGTDPAERVVEASDARQYSASTDLGTIEVVSSAGRDAAVLRLPPDVERPPEGSVYQAWFVGVDGSARSAGVLSREALEDGEMLLEGTPAGAAAVGLTVEPDGGSEQPTTEPFAVIPLS